MSQQIDFAAALDAAEQLDPDAQADLVAVLSRRLAERGRERLATVVARIRRRAVPTHDGGRNRPRGAVMNRTLLRSPAFARDLRNWL